MRTVTLIPGDGIGPEIAVAVQKIFAAAEVLFHTHLVLIWADILLMLVLANTRIIFWPQTLFCCSGSNCLGPGGCQPCQERRWHNGNSSGFYSVIKDFITLEHKVLLYHKKEIISLEHKVWWAFYFVIKDFISLEHKVWHKGQIGHGHHFRLTIQKQIFSHVQEAAFMCSSSQICTSQISQCWNCSLHWQCEHS